MESPIQRPPSGHLRSAFTEAGCSPFIAHRPVSRPLLRLIAILLLSAVLIVGFVALLGLLVGLLAPSAILQLPANFLSEAIPDTAERLYRESIFLSALAAILGGMALAILGAAAIVRWRSFSDLLWPGRRPSWRLLTGGFLFMAVAGLALWPFTWLIEGQMEPGPVFNPHYLAESRLIYAGVAAVMLLLAAAAEEIVFRGVLLRVLGGLTRRAWLIVLINGLLFSLIHLDPDPAAFVARAVSGMVWAWAALRLGGIEFAVGAHWANNLLIALFGEPMSEAASVDQHIAAIYLIPELAVAVLMLIATEWIVRRRQGAGAP